MANEPHIIGINLETDSAVGINALNFETDRPVGVFGLNLEGYDSAGSSVKTQFTSNVSFKSNTSINS
jgi:hypothetical protein